MLLRKIKDDIGLVDIFKDVEAKLLKAHERNARQYNLRRRPLSFSVGDTVWKRNYVLSDASEYIASKLAPRYIPCLVSKKVLHLTYRLKDSNGKDIGVWHVKDLKPEPDDETSNTALRKISPVAHFCFIGRGEISESDNVQTTDEIANVAVMGSEGDADLVTKQICSSLEIPECDDDIPIHDCNDIEWHGLENLAGFVGFKLRKAEKLGYILDSTDASYSWIYHIVCFKMAAEDEVTPAQKKMFSKFYGGNLKFARGLDSAENQNKEEGVGMSRKNRRWSSYRDTSNQYL
ncbi:hypothetical protein CBL_20346 [Carabus blaptoides fortunei]